MKKRDDLKILYEKVYSEPKYKGKHIIIIGGRIFAAKTGLTASKMLEELIKKHPRSTPSLTYIPKADTLILLK
ncbi:MAG: hypothetical protein COX46_03675 [bacterium (Candidatus Ratteibacteria) CG23_combo_of_CG06-09_8_20_14_all_48_7]|uniref:DUF5678 domain-containing protein n=1 Tax=bacterium (Candidatus Ratteibacteria) CG23_combo_of_CG06-09_8_20_14_all_48_7 TaxID=2014292 RepID=A0A2G9YAG6_9BACT|nr:MAG: hypothetical protein COX46_03675 [bacterium (Candidatus Ratteibacteria) CG23_combo_of_CG06-09_8_20_14_all_48_7]